MKLICTLIILFQQLRFTNLLSSPQTTTGNQQFAYPNKTVPPTAPSQFSTPPYQAQIMSQALADIDPHTKLRRQDFLSTFKFTFYQLSRGQAEQIFDFADMDHDDQLSQTEWHNFVALFVLPYEACDTNKDYFLNIDEFTNCFEHDPASQQVAFPPKNKTNKYSMLMEILTNYEGTFNFGHYIFLRKALFGWKQCQSGTTFITSANFQCALRLAVPQKYTVVAHYDLIYRTGINLANDQALSELDFLNYIRVVNFAYYFTVFSAPSPIPFIEKRQFLKAISEDRLPNKFDPDEINLFYQLINTNPFKPTETMNFPTFSFFFNHHLLFTKYSKDKPKLLKETEMNMMLNDVYFPLNCTLSVDSSFSNFSEKDYLEASLILQKLRPNEADFFYSFLEKVYKSNETPYFEINANAANRHVFFSTNASTRLDYWNKEDFYRAVQTCNLFIAFAEDIRRIVPVSSFLAELNTKYDSVEPNISLEQRGNFDFYKHFPQEIFFDVLTFNALENFGRKIYGVKASNSDKINETQLRLITESFGMRNLPATVLDTASVGLDSLKRRLFDVRKTIVNCMLVHAVAAENARTAYQQSVNNLPTVEDPSRKFPESKRRNWNSPLV